MLKKAWTDKHQADYLEKGYFKHLHKERISYLLESIQEFKLCRNQQKIRVLDIGCGDGVLTKYFEDKLTDDEIICLDDDYVRLERAKKRCHRAKFITGDFLAINLPSDYFDIIIAHHVIEHIPDDVRFLKKCHYHLKPGSLFILGIPHEGGIIGKISRSIHKNIYAEGEHIHFYTIDQIIKMLKDNIFSVISYKKFGFMFPIYHVHILLTWNPITFKIGHTISQYVDLTADSLIFTALKSGSSGNCA